MLIIISIILILISSIMGLVPIFRKFFQSRPEFFTFALTLMATFIGVFWAIEFNNRNEEKIETDNAIKLLNATKLEIKNKIVTNKMYLAIIDKSLSSCSPREFIQNNPIQLSNLFQTTISNELILREISENGIQALHSCNDNLVFLQQSLNNNTTIEDSSVAGLLKSYIEELDLSIKIIDLEIKYLQNKTSDDIVNVEYDSLFIKHNKEENMYNLDSAIERKNEEQK